MGKRACPLLQCGPALGAEAVPGAAVRAGRDQWFPDNTGKYQSYTGAVIHHSAVQLPVPDRMYVPGAETADGRVLLPLLDKIHAETEPLSEEG